MNNIHMNTSNKSFLDMHYYLKSIGVRNDSFHLLLLDEDLMLVDPLDPTLSEDIKKKVLTECSNNYWYFIREVVRIPDFTDIIESGDRYKIHRGNLALNFGFTNNWNMILELPSRKYKSISAICRYLWIFNFTKIGSNMAFIDTNYSNSELNCIKLKMIRDTLPQYLKVRESHDIHDIIPIPGAKTEIAANSLGRGMTQPIHWYDNYARIKFIDILHSVSYPLFKNASVHAINNDVPYGILMSSTPGDINTKEGLSTFNIKENSSVFNENMYDMSTAQLDDIISKNGKLPFVYIRFTYSDLGEDE